MSFTGVVGYGAPLASGRPRLRVADVLRTVERRLVPTLDPAQTRALEAILACRTSALGGVVTALCKRCDYQEIAYCSCRNRHCPSCQWPRQCEWLAKRMERVLPVGHFHVVFTLPSELRPLAWCNRRAMYSLLFQASSATLRKFSCDDRHLGGDLGVTAVLHTWNRDLSYHPHVHCIVTDGGLSRDGKRWVRPKRGPRKKKSQPFLFPVRAMMEVFRGKVLAGVARLRSRGELTYAGSSGPLVRDDAFAELVKGLSGKRWVVYAKPPFEDTEQLFRYLGRYTHRVGISDGRLVSLHGGEVTFKTRHGETRTLEAVEFGRRFFQHILPPGFTKMRHYGLYAGASVKGRLEVARKLLEAESPADGEGTCTGEKPGSSVEGGSSEAGLVDLIYAVTGMDVTQCPICGERSLHRFSHRASRR